MIHGTPILGQVLTLRPRAHVESLDKTYNTRRPSRVLSRWNQVGTLVWAQWAGRHSLRDFDGRAIDTDSPLVPPGGSRARSATPEQAS